MKKKLLIIIVILLVFLIGVGFLLRHYFSEKKTDSDDVVLKDNVIIINEETKEEDVPLEVTENSLIYGKKQKYSKGDVVVSGIIDVAPNGFVRKIENVSESNGVFKYETKPAVLTEIFEEAHVIKTFAVTDTEVRDIEEINNGVMTLDLSASGNAFAQNLISPELSNSQIQQMATTQIKPSENGLGVVVELEENFGKGMKVKGQVEVNTYLEVKLDIEDGEIDFGMAVHTDTSGELFAGYQAELFDKDNKDEFNGDYTKELISKALPSFQFSIGPVPVVITNDFELSAEVSTQLEGQIGTTMGVNAERVSGFEYSSRTGDIKEINDRKYLSDGMKWDTEAKAKGEFEVGIFAHLVTKLYGSTGVDLSVGIAANVNGELGIGVNKELEPLLYGKLALGIGPKVSGKLVVTDPVIDYSLVETEILKVELPAFWDKVWEVPDPMLIAMKAGDFSCFAGKYIATPEDNDAMGGGKKLEPLELKKDGSLSGGGSDYYKNPYPKTKPISVSKNEDGSYKCVWETGYVWDPAFPNEKGAPYESYYTIYPVGVIEDNEYAKEKQSYLKDIVYIVCKHVEGGGAYGTYYDDSIENKVLDYDGSDWVKCNELPEEIGVSFTSGTGVKYTVLALENNFVVGGGRQRIVFVSEDGKKRMVPNIPAFELDTRAGVIYYNIYEYESDPNYVEYMG